MKKFSLDGTEYNRETVTEFRKNIIQLRNEALKAGIMDWAVALTHVIVLLSKIAEEIEE